MTKKLQSTADFCIKTHANPHWPLRAFGGLVCLVAMLLLPTGPLQAYKPGGPKRHDVSSPNGLFTLDVNPRVDRLKVFHFVDKEHPLWSFRYGIWLDEPFLSNNGEVVAIVSYSTTNPKANPAAVCLEFWDRTGLFKSYTFSELYPGPQPTGDGPSELQKSTWYEKALSDGEQLRIRTTEGKEFKFWLKDGLPVKTWSERLSGPLVFLIVIGVPVVFVVLGVTRTIIRKRREKAIIHREMMAAQSKPA